MTAVQAPIRARQPSPAPDATPVALLHLDLSDARSIQDAATALYRQTRQGRRVVAVASGPVQDLAHAADRIGLETVVAAPHAPELVHQPVVIVPGGVAAREDPACCVQPLRVALAGCGVVGGGLYQRLSTDPGFEIVAVLVRNPDRRRDPQPDPAHLVATREALVARRPDVVIDVLSDAAVGLALTEQALSAGISVISANKQAIGPARLRLAALAAESNARLGISACVGGGAPIIETLLRAAGHAPVVRIEGVLNGTVNYLLNRLSSGSRFAEAVADAQRAGFAEADPAFDLDGRDAAAKLSLLAGLAWPSAPRLAAVEPLSGRTRLPSGPVRQIARAGIEPETTRIAFEPVAHDPLFANLPDEWNAVRVTCEDGRVFTCRGRGAGRWPTAESVWSDLLDLAQARR